MLSSPSNSWLHAYINCRCPQGLERKENNAYKETTDESLIGALRAVKMTMDQYYMEQERRQILVDDIFSNKLPFITEIHNFFYSAIYFS